MNYEYIFGFTDRAILVLQLQAIPLPARFCGFLPPEKCVLADLSGAIFIPGTLILSEKALRVNQNTGIIRHLPQNPFYLMFLTEYEL